MTLEATSSDAGHAVRCLSHLVPVAPPRPRVHRGDASARTARRRGDTVELAGSAPDGQVPASSDAAKPVVHGVTDGAQSAVLDAGAAVAVAAQLANLASPQLTALQAQVGILGSLPSRSGALAMPTALRTAVLGVLVR